MSFKQGTDIIQFILQTYKHSYFFLFQLAVPERTSNTHVSGVLFEDGTVVSAGLSPLTVQSQQREVMILWVGHRIPNLGR